MAERPWSLGGRGLQAMLSHHLSHGKSKRRGGKREEIAVMIGGSTSQHRTRVHIHTARDEM
ncbi:hypothetical protein N7488_010397 [Penicillium malachiteum]|nr:hypothetical protein N7488_010397 [Penicillium malachiteum]